MARGWEGREGGEKEVEEGEGDEAGGEGMSVEGRVREEGEGEVEGKYHNSIGPFLSLFTSVPLLPSVLLLRLLLLHIQFVFSSSFIFISFPSLFILSFASYIIFLVFCLLHLLHQAFFAFFCLLPLLS